MAFVNSGILTAATLFRDGFEQPCSASDTDGDRLSDCEEIALGTRVSLRDTDGDGIADGDEVLGTVLGLDLPGMGANPLRKDIFIEYDWFEDSQEAGSGTCPAGTAHSHRPTPAMLAIVTKMFADAPVENPNGESGIHVVHDFGQGGLFEGGNVVPDADGIVEGDVFKADYIDKYETHFAPARRGYFHYVLMPHRYRLPSGDLSSSGYAEIDGGLYTDAIIVSLYCSATTSNVAQTIAHELGHNLGLNHGGARGDRCNRKPNYNSLMNHRFQFDGIDADCKPGNIKGPADFSRGLRLAVDETALSEAQGMCAGVPADWNGDGTSNQVLANFDLNAYPDQVAECGGTFTTLHDHDDWSAIVLNITHDGGQGGGGNELAGAYCAAAAPMEE